VNTLSLREAAARYGIPPSTVSSWYRAGLIRSISAGRRGQPTLLIEADVAALASLYTPGPGGYKRARLAERLVSGA
jgi:hypothetical protein